MTFTTITSLEHLDDVLAGDLPVLLDFTAQWCSPCKQTEPDLHGFAADNAGRIVVAAIDIDEHPDIYQQWGINGVPSYRLVHGGQVQMASSGVYRESLDDWYGTYLDDHPVAPDDGQPRPEGPPATSRFPEDAHDEQVMLDDSALADLIERGPWQSIVTTHRWLSDDDLVRLVSAVQPRSLVLMGAHLHDDPAGLMRRLQAAAPSTIVGSNWCAPEVARARQAAGRSSTIELPVDTGVRNLSASMKLMRRGGRLQTSVALLIPTGWYAFPPGSADGLGLEVLSTTDGVTLTMGDIGVDDEGHLSNIAQIPLVIDGDADSLSLELRVQLCSGAVCNPPVTLEVSSGPVLDLDARTNAAPA